MARSKDRIGIVGATSLLGKELSEELAESPLSAAEVVLFEQDAVEGQISSAGDEASFVQALDEDSFKDLDLLFFAGTAEQTRAHWQAARRGGALVVDLTHALVGKPGVLLRAPRVSEALGEFSRHAGEQPNLETATVVVAHPMAAALALLAARLLPDVEQMAATVMLPASEHGSAALDELHQQTVNLLSFHELPRTQFDAQSAFNLLAAFGEDAKSGLGSTAREIAEDYRAVGHAQLAPLLLQLIQAPVFHGYAASVLVELSAATTAEAVASRLGGRYVEIVAEAADAPSNLSAAGTRDLLVRVDRANGMGEAAERQVWLWMAADNLKLRASGAIECAVELRRLRPTGKVQ